MKLSITKFGLPLALLLLAIPASAQVRDGVGYSSLTICNRGTIPFNVVVAMDNEPLPAIHRWNVYGWFFIDPKGCKKVHHSSLGPPAYIGFGYYDVQGQFGAGSIDQVPDIGFLEYNWVQAAMYGKSKVPVLTKTSKKLCVNQSGVSYTLNDSPETNCSTLDPQGSTGPYFPFATTLFFQPMPSRCVGGTYGISVSCGGGHYYLNVVASPNGWHMSASRGSASESGTDQPAADSGSSFDDFLKGMLENSRKQQAFDEAKKKAEEAQRLEAVKKAIEARRTNPVWISYEKEQQAKWGAPSVSAGDYNAVWKGKQMHVSGTVARVSVANGNPRWLTLRFSESPNGAFVVCSPSPSIFSGLFGNDLNALVGKKVEVIGYVQGTYCDGTDGSIRVVDSDSVRLLQ